MNVLPSPSVIFTTGGISAALILFAALAAAFFRKKQTFRFAQNGHRERLVLPLLLLAAAAGMGMHNAAAQDCQIGTAAAPVSVSSRTSLNQQLNTDCQTGTLFVYLILDTNYADDNYNTVTIPEGVNAVIDLNGKTLDGNKSGSVITVNGNLTLEDSSGGSGTITGGKADNGGGVYVGKNSTFTMKGGTITHNNSTKSGGGVYIGNNASFTIEDGTISDNEAGSNGGGVYVDNWASFTMEDGTISDNKADTAHGGGVYIGGYASFTMEDGTISDNKADTAHGGGVYVDIFASFTMNSGSISGNNAGSNGGGVYNSYKFSMSGGSISDNSANAAGGVFSSYEFEMGNAAAVSGNHAKNGGGVYLIGETFTMSGSAAISGNTADNNAGGVGVSSVSLSFSIKDSPVISNNTAGTGRTDNNLVLPGSRKITVSGALTSGASIWIRMDGGPGVFTDTGTTAWNESRYFHSDDDAYAVGKNADGQLFLGAIYTVTLDQQGGSGGTASVTAIYGAEMPTPITLPSRTGYTFGGYYDRTNGGGTKYYNADGTSATNWDKTSGATLYAKWTGNRYTVTLSQQTATNPGTTSVTAIYGSAMPRITNLPSRTGYTFEGYFTEPNGRGTQYYTKNGTSAKVWDSTSGATLFPKWKARTFTVTLDQTDAETFGTESVTATYNAEMPAITSLPTRTGYSFGGYFTQTNGGGTQYYNADGTSAKVWDRTGGATLYPKWTANTYTLTVTAPTFTDVVYGYTQPAAQAITITSSGNSDATIASVEVSGSNFTIDRTGAVTTVSHGGTNTSYKIQPVSGLNAGTSPYTGTITVTYNDGATAMAEVSLTVNPAENTLAVNGSLPVEVIRGGNTFDLKSHYKNAVGDVSYSVSYPADDPARDCSVDANGIFTSGNTAGGCVVKVTAAGNTNYKAKTVEITVEVTEKPVAELSVTQESVISGQSLPDPVYEDHGIITGTLTVSYSGSGYGPSEEKPTEPGSYTVTVSYETKNKLYTGSESFTIIEATHELTVIPPSFSAVTYGYAQPAAAALSICNGGNSTASITLAGLSGSGASAFTLNTTDGTTIASGETDSTTYSVQPNASLDADTYTAMFTVTYNDGKTAEAEVSFTVNPAENTLEVTGSLPVEVIRGGNTFDLKSYYKDAVGDVTYSVSYPADDPARDCSVDANGIFTSGNTAGGCVVKVTAKGNTNYKAKTLEITVEVTEKPVAELSVTQESAISGQTLPDPVYEDHGIITGTLTVSYSGSGYGPSGEKPTEPGSYTVTVSYETKDKLYTGSASFTIIEATHELTVLAPSFSPVTYGYDPQPAAGMITLSNGGNSDAEVTSISLVGDGASAFTLKSAESITLAPGATDTSCTVQPAAGLKAGTYTAVITVESNDGTKTAEVEFTVSPKAATVTAEDKDKIEGASDPELTAAVDGTLGSDTLAYSLSRETGETPGTYTINVTGEKSQGNYTVSFVSGTFTIYEKNASRVITKPIAAQGLKADGSMHDLLSEAGKAEGGKIMYSVNGGTWSAKPPQASKAGSYEIAWYVKGDSTHKDSGSPTKPLGTVTAVIADEPMNLKVKFIFITGSGSRGVPFDVKDTKLNLSILIKDGKKTVAQSESLTVEITAGAKGKTLTASFPKKIEGLAPGKYSVSVSGLPKTVDITDYGGDPAKYKLSAKAEINVQDGKTIITVYLIFKEQYAPEEPVVYPLPEDEIGAYAIREDGTKEYLLFQTYDICMAWLGSAELCEGPQRCYHKDGK